jgi:GNAT superfamily N-acetyltransferase
VSDPSGVSGPSGVNVRPARAADVETIYGFIRELAAYERAPDQVTGTAQMLDAALFGGQPSAEALIAERDDEVIGFALYHGTFSTWECLPGLWLEDLYVPERFRRGGAGLALLSALAEITVQRGCARLEWTALDWNEPALAFYASLDAERLEEWTTHRLSGPALTALAGRAERT